jgi:hypothetical protein
LHYWHDDFLKLLIQQKSIYQAVFGLIEALPIPAPLLDLVEVGPIGLNAPQTRFAKLSCRAISMD